jgi:hypothetical protein
VAAAVLPIRLVAVAVVAAGPVGIVHLYLEICLVEIL